MPNIWPIFHEILLLIDTYMGAAVAEWLSSWLAEQEDRGSIAGLATWIFRDRLSPASKSRYVWKTAKSTLILKITNNQPLIHIVSNDNTQIYWIFLNSYCIQQCFNVT